MSLIGGLVLAQAVLHGPDGRRYRVVAIPSAHTYMAWRLMPVTDPAPLDILLGEGNTAEEAVKKLLDRQEKMAAKV